MRMILNTVAAAMIMALLAGAWLHDRAKRQEDHVIASTRADVQRLAREAKVRGATDAVDRNGRGWPLTIDPAWFEGAPPMNRMVSHDRPWLEVAGPEEADLEHPQIRVAVDRTVAAFWYNPSNGVVRARAPVTVSDLRCTEMYNRVNGCVLASVYADILPRERMLRSLTGESAALAGVGEDGALEFDEAEMAPEDLSAMALDPTRDVETGARPAASPAHDPKQR